MSWSPWVYIVLLGLLFVVFSRLLPKSEPSSAKLVKEVEETMEMFAAGLEEENEELLRSVAEMKSEHERKVQQLNGKIEQLEKQYYDLSQEVKQLLLMRMETKPEKQPPAAPERADPMSAPASIMNIKERYPELFQLHGQGKSVEYIAKKLGMNKGEVNLIVQLARQEAAGRV